MIKIKRKNDLNLIFGQSLAEVLIALAVGVIFILGVIISVQFSIKINKDAERIQVSTFLAKELMDNIKIFTESNWHNILGLSTTSANHYYLNTTSSPFTAIAGEETILISTTTYIRYFYVDDVISGDSIDPSIKKITVVSKWFEGNDRIFTTYLTRWKNRIFLQTDWSGGGGQIGPITSTNNKFDTSTNIDFSTTTGSILLKLGY